MTGRVVEPTALRFQSSTPVPYDPAWMSTVSPGWIWVPVGPPLSAVTMSHGEADVPALVERPVVVTCHCVPVLTVPAEVPWIKPSVVVIVTAPTATPVTNPLELTVAIVLSLDDHVTVSPLMARPN